MSLSPDALADAATDQSPACVQGITSRQPKGSHASRRVGVGYALCARKERRHEARAGIVTEVLGFVRPACDEKTQVQPGGDQILVQVQNGEAARRVPSSSTLHGETRVQRILPGWVGDAQPGVAVR